MRTVLFNKKSLTLTSLNYYFINDPFWSKGLAKKPIFVLIFFVLILIIGQIYGRQANSPEKHKQFCKVEYNKCIRNGFNRLRRKSCAQCITDCKKKYKQCLSGFTPRI